MDDEDFLFEEGHVDVGFKLTNGRMNWIHVRMGKEGLRRESERLCNAEIDKAVSAGEVFYKDTERAEIVECPGCAWCGD